MKRIFPRLVLAAVLATSVFGAVDRAYADGDADRDPWSGMNRVIFSFNDTLDTYLLAPVARGYDSHSLGDEVDAKNHTFIRFPVGGQRPQRFRGIPEAGLLVHRGHGAAGA